MTQRRVLVALDESDVGRNALWWAVEYARRLDAPLYVVELRATTLAPVPVRSAPPVSDARWLALATVAVADALLLAVGEPPPGVRILTASVAGRAPATLVRLADRDGDLVVLSRAPRRGTVTRCRRGARVRMLFVPDATGEPVPARAPVS